MFYPSIGIGVMRNYLENKEKSKNKEAPSSHWTGLAADFSMFKGSISDFKISKFAKYGSKINTPLIDFKEYTPNKIEKDVLKKVKNFKDIFKNLSQISIEELKVVAELTVYDTFKAHQIAAGLIEKSEKDMLSDYSVSNEIHVASFQIGLDSDITTFQELHISACPSKVFTENNYLVNNYMFDLKFKSIRHIGPKKLRLTHTRGLKVIDSSSLNAQTFKQELEVELDHLLNAFELLYQL